MRYCVLLGFVIVSEMELCASANNIKIWLFVHVNCVYVQEFESRLKVGFK